MLEDKLPRLTEAHVRELATEKSFDRGEAYYHDGPVLESFRQERELRSRLAGRSQEELIALIGELIKREPQLLSLIELYIETEWEAQGRPDAAA